MAITRVQCCNALLDGEAAGEPWLRRFEKRAEKRQHGAVRAASDHDWQTRLASSQDGCGMKVNIKRKPSRNNVDAVDKAGVETTGGEGGGGGRLGAVREDVASEAIVLDIRNCTFIISK